MNNAITNKGTVTVNANKTVSSTSFINNGVITVKGTVSKVTNNENAKVTVKNGGNFTINGKNKGSVYLENGSTSSSIANDATGKLVYAWNNNGEAPEDAIAKKVTALELNNVTIENTTIFSKVTIADITGVITVPNNSKLQKWNINVVEDASIASKDNSTNSTILVANVNVKEGKTLRTAEKTTLDGTSTLPATIILEKGASFNGNKGTYVNINPQIPDYIT